MIFQLACVTFYSMYLEKEGFAVEMAQWLQALSLAKDRGLFSEPTQWLTTICHSSSTQSYTYFWPLQIPGSHEMQYVHAGKHLHT